MPKPTDEITDLAMHLVNSGGQLMSLRNELAKQNSELARQNTKVRA